VKAESTIRKGTESICLDIPIEKLERGKVLQNSMLTITKAWAIKIRVDDNNNLGIYLSNILQGNNEGKDFYNFHTAIYNFQVEDNPLVYNTCGVFAFPKVWNFINKPTKIMNIEILKRSLTILHIRCWLTEDTLHSALLHYIGCNMQRLIENISEDDLILIPVKDLYSLLESEVLNVKNEDIVLEFVGRYVMYHHNDSINDLLRSLRVNKVSTEGLLEAMRNSVLSRNAQFVSKVATELDFRSNFYLTDIRKIMGTIIE
jgi:hypothetical protein